MTRQQALQTAKPILFSTDMVRAILDGRKTVTRRVIKLDSHYDPNEIGCEFVEAMYKPPFQIGDILYVREAFAELKNTNGNKRYVYKATDKYPFGEKYIVKFKWKPSIHMPKNAARIFLRVTDVRAKRLKDIKIFDIISEGLAETCLAEACRECFEDYGYGYQCRIGEDDECLVYDEIMSNWQDLWNSTVKKSDLAKYGWAVNPWVWVIEFEKLEVE